MCEQCERMHRNKGYDNKGAITLEYNKSFQSIRMQNLEIRIPKKQISTGDNNQSDSGDTDGEGRH